ncbi:MAG: VanZ family protein [Verrucomicrobiae bacterium]
MLAKVSHATMQQAFPFLKRWFPLAAWVGIVLYASTGICSGDETSRLLRAILAWFHSGHGHSGVPLGELNFFLRKSAHVLQFLIYALLVWRGLSMAPAWETLPRRIALWAIGSAAVLAMASEGLQMLSPVRSPLWGDVMLDVTGAAAGAACAMAVQTINGLLNRRLEATQ